MRALFVSLLRWPVLVAAFLCSILRRAIPVYWDCLGRTPLHIAIMVVLALLVAGLVGADYGLSDLFWHEDWQVQLVAGSSLAALVMTLGMLRYVLANEEGRAELFRHSMAGLPVANYPLDRGNSGEVPDDTKRLRAYLQAIIAPVELALVLPLLLGLIRPLLITAGLEARTFSVSALDVWALPLGAWLTWGVADRVLGWAGPALRVEQYSHRHVLLVALVIPLTAYSLELLGPPLQACLTAAVCICLVAWAVAMLGFWTYGKPYLKLAVIAAALAGIGWANGGQPYKLTYPGLDSFYPPAAPIEVQFLTEPAGSHLGMPGAASGPPLLGRLVRAKPGTGRTIDQANDQLRRNPDSPTSYESLGDAYAALGDDIRAIGYYRRAADRFPAHQDHTEKARVLEKLGAAHLRHRDINRAVKAYEEATRLSPDDAEAWLGLGDAQSFFALSTARAEDNQTWLRRAMESYSSALEHTPGGTTEAQAYIGRATARMDLREEGVLEDLGQVVPSQRGVGYYLLLFENHDKPEDKLNDLTQAIALDPDNPRIYLERARLQDDTRAMFADLDAAIRLSPDFIKAIVTRARLRARSGDERGAADDYDQAARVLVRATTDATAGRVLQDGRGIVRSDGWAELPSNLPFAFVNNEAVKLARSKQLSEAAGRFTKILSQPTADPDRLAQDYVRLNLATALCYDNRGDQAVGHFQTFLRARGEDVRDLYGSESSTLLPDDHVLERWKQQWARAGRTKPPLVVLATSGGGIAATYWTIACLNRIEELCHEFPYHIRLVTGASGGMAGAAYYVATLTGQPYPLTHVVETSRLLDEMTGDSLTPIVRRLVLWDLPSIFDWRTQHGDRGRVLDATWSANTQGRMGQDFRHLLLQGEREGWRPSLVISPMLVEDGYFLLISNLDLGFLPGGEFYKLFDPAQIDPKTGFSLATAARMSAAFPYVTPGVMLPTSPPRRVVDSGYLDNYGVGVAAAWIDKNREWLLTNTSHVLLVELRAYPTPDLAKPTEGFLDRLMSGLSFATTPLEGYSTAKAAAAKARNAEAVERLRESLNRVTSDFFLEFVLECTEKGQAPLSWALSRQARERLGSALKANEPEFLRLCSFLGDR